MDEDDLTYFPHPIQTLRDENFRAVRIATGDSICVAVSSEGELRAWGTIRVCEFGFLLRVILKHTIYRATKASSDFLKV